MRRRRLAPWCCLLVALSAFAPTAAQTGPPEAPPTSPGIVAAEASLRAAIDDAARAEVERQGLVGLAVGVILDGRVVYTAGYGWADREQRTPVTTDTVFRWASISKPLTAIVAMQLADEGKLDLDSDVRALVPEFPDKGVTITPRQLLGHLGGIVHYTNGQVIRTLRTYETKYPFEDVINALDTFKESPLVNPPGEKYAYSSHAYVLLSAVVQRAGAQKYADQVRTRIAEPLGMTTLRPDYQWEGIPNRAVGYRKRGGAVVRSWNTDASWKLGGGGWISSIDDLARFTAGLIGDELLTPGSKAEAWTRQTTSAGKRTNYGLGFSVIRRDGRLGIGHNGSQQKARTRMVLYPDERYGVVVMSNCQYAQTARITAALFAAIDAWRDDALKNAG